MSNDVDNITVDIVVNGTNIEASDEILCDVIAVVGKLLYVVGRIFITVSNQKVNDIFPKSIDYFNFQAINRF